MLHPFIRPRLRDFWRAARFPEHASSDAITRVAAQHVECLHSEESGRIPVAEWCVVIFGLLSAAWALGGGC